MLVNSIDEMHVLASRIANDLNPGDVLLLEGELGSGKTTFVQGLAEALGVKERVTSPTFAIVSEYKTGKSARIKRLIHVDLYRLSEEEVIVQELFDERARQGEVTVIEWADRLGNKVLTGSKKIKFAHGATKKERVVTI